MLVLALLPILPLQLLEGLAASIIRMIVPVTVERSYTIAVCSPWDILPYKQDANCSACASKNIRVSVAVPKYIYLINAYKGSRRQCEWKTGKTRTYIDTFVLCLKYLRSKFLVLRLLHKKSFWKTILFTYTAEILLSNTREAHRLTVFVISDRDSWEFHVKTPMDRTTALTLASHDC